MSVPLLQLTKITKSFGAVQALRGVSLELRAGEVHALVGENGAGKSTLIKIITGAHQPDSGQIQIAGEQVARLTPGSAHRSGIACVYQQPALFPDLSVAENIGLRLESPNPARRIRWSERRRRCAQLLEGVGANISPDAEAGRLSMPEQQLVEIACALGAGARVVIMDEPTASLTQKEQHLLFKVVRDLCKKQVGVIYISHRLDEVFALAERVTVLRDGESVGTRFLRPPQAFDAVGVPVVTESELIQMMVGRPLLQGRRGRRLGADEGGVILSLKNVSCAAGGIRNVSLELRAGEILGLAGLVGAGRTELARVLFGITPADSGEILLNGQRIILSSPEQAIDLGLAYLPEDRRRHGIIPEMPIAANITMAIHRRIFPRAWLRFEAERQLALGYIRDLDVHTSGSAAPASFLSGGNQQKVALARWLAAKPKVLILDEPTQGVDIAAKSEIHKIIHRLADQGVGVLIISSELPEVLAMSDRIAVMRGGAIGAMLPGGSDAHRVMAAAFGQIQMTPAATHE